MRHPFRVREIAAQAGLSEATVDRALHGRPGVRPSTARQVERAIADLQRQADQLQLGGRTWVLDVVVQAPLRFSVEVRAALEAELPGLRPAVVRARFHLLDGSDPGPVVAALRAAVGARSDGVVLKAPQHPDVVAAVAALAEAGVPVVTLVTDLPGSARTAYVGLDNRGAGRTAAHLVDQWLGADRPEGGDVLVVRSGSADLGEDERAAGFAEVLGPRRVLEVRDHETRPHVVVDDLRAALREDDDDGAPAPVIAAVYAMYAGAGGATAVLEELARHGRAPRVVVVHDLAAEHLALLRDGRVSAVLHHDLRPHLRRAARVLLQSRGGLPGPVRSWASPVQVVTRFNVPRTGEA